MSSSSSFSEEEPASRGEEDEAPPPSLPAPEATLPVPNNAPPAPPADPFKKATWADVVYDEEGGVIGILGREWRVINAKDVRSVCMSLGLSGGLRTTKKEDMINRIIAAAFNRPKYARLVAEEYNSSDDDDDETPKLVGATRRNKTKKKASSATRKEAQCPFRLMNLLFSDQFAQEFGELGKIADRQTLDAGKAAHGQHFWEKVQKAFVDEASNTVCGELDYTDSDDVFAGVDHIDCSKIVPHSWKKLEQIWRSLHAEYKAAFSRFTRSGNHDSNFFAFCTGRLAVYYLWKKLQERPHLNAFVEAALPEGCNMQSEGYASSTTTDTSSTRKAKKARPDPAALAGAIKDLGTSFEKSKQDKQELHALKKTMLEKQNIREDKMLAIEERKAKVYEWEKIGDAIDKVYANLGNPNLRQSDKDRLYKELDRLHERKEKLTTSLDEEAAPAAPVPVSNHEEQEESFIVLE